MPYRTVSRDSSVLQQAIRRLRESRCKWLLVVNEVFDIAVNNFDAKKSVHYSWLIVVIELDCKWDTMYLGPWWLGFRSKQRRILHLTFLAFPSFIAFFWKYNRRRQVKSDKHMFWDVVVNTDSRRKGSFEKQKIKKIVSSVERVLCFTDFGHPGMMGLIKGIV